MLCRFLATLATITLLAACAATTSPPPAEPRPEHRAPEMLDVPEYREFLSELRENVENGVPRQLSRREMQRFNELDRSLHTLLASVNDIDQLNHDDRTKVFNAHEAIWSTVVGRDEDQMICRRETRVGSHFSEMRCRPLADIRREQRAAQSLLMQEYRNEHMVAPEPGDGAPAVAR